MADPNKTDSSFDQQLHNASRAARMREERVVQEQTGLSRSQIRKGGLVDALRGDANEFARRVDEVKHPRRHVPQVKVGTQHVAAKSIPSTQRAQGSSDMSPAQVTVFAINNGVVRPFLIYGEVQ